MTPAQATQAAKAALAAQTAQAGLLQQGVQAHKQGRLDAAQDAFDAVLRQDPEQPDALHLLGGLREDVGLWAGAEWCYRRAAEFRPGYIEAHYNRARMLRQLGHAELAAQSLKQALRLKPPSPTFLAQMLQLRAQLEEDAGQLQQALATLDQALEAAPQRAALHHNRGVVLQRLSRPAQALAAHDHALALGLASAPGAADAHYNRGNSLQSLGRSADALVAYSASLALMPQHALALYDSARLRWRLGDVHFSAGLDAAAAAAPASPLAPGIKGRLLLRAERFADAAAAFAHAAALTPATAGYFDGLGQALARLGRLDEALAAHQRALGLAPQQAAIHINHASSLLQAGDVAHATKAAETAVGLAPLDQQAWALLGLAWRAGGHPHEVWLNDYHRHVQVFDLAPPEGWADVAGFNAALAAVLTQLHTDAQAPIDQTLRHGSQTLGDLFEQGHPLVAQLKGRIAAAVDRYIAHLHSLPRDDGHPLLGRSTTRWRFTDSWSSRLRGGGYHTNHVHPHGWISSCYYVALPPAITAPAAEGVNPHAGWIGFGAPDITVPGSDLAAQRAVQPRVGRLVLFPSFMWHGTVPFHDTQPRLTVAFDVMPLV